MAPGTTTLAEFFATAVMVAVVLPSAEIVAALVLTVIVPNGSPHPPAPSPVIWHELPPHAAKNAEVKANQTIIEILRMSKHPSLTSCRR